MKNRWFVAAGLAAVLAAGVAGTAIAQSEAPQGPRPQMRRGGPGGPRGDMRFGGPLLNLRELDLTDAQREQVRTIMESHRTEFQAIATRLGDAHRGMAELTTGDSVDEAAIRAKSAEVAAAMADEAILRAKVNAEVFGILTPEQQQKAKELRAQRGQRGQRLRR